LLKMLRRIISGGQTGADRAGLDFAIHVGLEHGGYVPKGRKAEDGKIAERYNLVELSTTSYPARTKRNTEESDGTVIFSLERLLSGGTKLLWDLPTSLGSRCGGSRTHRATSSRTLAKRKLAPSSSRPRMG
jgi:Circularly permutated YpsA SLOG family